MLFKICPCFTLNTLSYGTALPQAHDIQYLGEILSEILLLSLTDCSNIPYRWAAYRWAVVSESAKFEKFFS